MNQNTVFTRSTRRKLVPIFIGTFALLACFSSPVVNADSDKSRFKNKLVDFPAPQADFSAHIADVEAYLLATRMPQRSAEDVAYNLPFEASANPQVSYRGKFMLIHGLNDSPYVWTDVSKQLTARGYDVRAILLPGHGNTPEAQLDMSYKRWVAVARQQLALWQQESDAPIYLGGFSLGAVIATLLALEQNETPGLNAERGVGKEALSTSPVSGLLLFSPAFRSSMNHLLRWSSIYSRFKPWVFGGMIIEDNPTKYNSIPINGAAQYYKTTRLLARRWKQRSIAVPALLVASSDDSVVDIDYTLKIFETRFSNDKKQLLLYTNENSPPPNTMLTTRRSAYPEYRILNQSHQSVLMSPANPLFGINGSVLVCNGNDWPTFSGCLYHRGEHWFGAQHTPSPDGTPVARVTYNPDFAGVFNAFDAVFAIATTED